MRADFYHLTRDPAEEVIPRLAEQTLRAGERLLVVSGEREQLDRISQALWCRRPESFLAHGRAGAGAEDGPDDGHQARQPILLSDAPEPSPGNAARFCILADGRWREEASRFARVFYLFDAPVIDAARACWRELGGARVERRYWKQDGGRWVEGP